MFCPQAVVLCLALKRVSWPAVGGSRPSAVRRAVGAKPAARKGQRIFYLISISGQLSATKKEKAESYSPEIGDKKEESRK